MPNGLRTLIVAFVAAAVAVLPLAGGVHAASHATTEAAAPITEHGDCCDHGKPCEKKTPDGCGSTAGCLVKCSTLSATVAAMPATSGLAPAGETANFVVERLGSLRDNPPSPPPRI